LEPPVKIVPELAAVSLVMTVKRRLSVHKFIHNPLHQEGTILGVQA
jgi:hypothetical protein